MSLAQNKLITYTLIGVAGLLFWNKIGSIIHAAYNFAFKINKIRFVPAGENSSQLQLYTLIHNVTSRKVFVDAFRANIFFNNTLVGFVDTPIARVIHPKAITEVLLPINLDLNEGIQQILRDMTSSVIHSWNIRFVGDITVEGSTIPIDTVITVQNIEEILSM